MCTQVSYLQVIYISSVIRFLCLLFMPEWTLWLSWFFHTEIVQWEGGRYHFVQIIRCTITPDMVVMVEVALLLNIKYSYLVYPTITMVLGNKAIVGAVSVSPSLSFQRYKTSSWIIHLYLRCCVLEAVGTDQGPGVQGWYTHFYTPSTHAGIFMMFLTSVGNFFERVFIILMGSNWTRRYLIWSNTF